MTDPDGGPPLRVLLAPVTVTPTKPLTPSHLKGLLWTDVMFRATARLAEVDYRCSHTTYHPTEQTVGFWAYLDRTVGDTDYSTCTEKEIGELYVRYRTESPRTADAAVRSYVDAIEHHGWVHPASARILELWSAHYRGLGMHDPGLTAHQPPGMTLEQAIDRLAALGMCVDLRAAGGPVYLDATREGLPLRQLVAADGRPNYLACALRELIPLAVAYDEIVLLFDRELATDYLLLRHVLSRLGPVVHRVGLGRVPIDGRVRSARHGDWRTNTVGAVLGAAGAEHDRTALRVGMRLYFISVLGQGSHESFRPDVLRRWLRRADRLARADAEPEGVPLAEFLAGHRGGHGYVDPYRLTSGLLVRHRRFPLREVLAEVFT